MTRLIATILCAMLLVSCAKDGINTEYLNLSCNTLSLCVGEVKKVDVINSTNFSYEIVSPIASPTRDGNAINIKGNNVGNAVLKVWDNSAVAYCNIEVTNISGNEIDEELKDETIRIVGDNVSFIYTTAGTLYMKRNTNGSVTHLFVNIDTDKVASLQYSENFTDATFTQGGATSSIQIKMLKETATLYWLQLSTGIICVVEK